MVESDIIEELKKLKADFWTATKAAIESARYSKEEKLKIEVETAIGITLERLGLDIATFRSYEMSKMGISYFVAGRMDAVYGYIVLEYKSYGLMDSPTELQKATEQLQGYLAELPKEKVVGLAFDGKTMVFLRWSGTWITREEPVIEDTMYELLLLVVGLKRKILSPEKLRDDFELSTIFGQGIIQVLYKHATLSTNDRVLMLFAEWERKYSEIYKHAFDDEGIKRDFVEFSKGLKIEHVDINKFLFVLHTYYALIVKLMASEVATTVLRGLVPSYLDRLSRAKDIHNELARIEEGGVFKESLGIDNFLEGDFFSWYLDDFDAEVETAVRSVLEKMRDYDFATFIERPEDVTDLLKRFYQYIVPQRLRHDLGEVYTPDWLAQLVIDESGYNGDPNIRVLDPACGSGTFLVLIIKEITRWFHEEGKKSGWTPRKIIDLIQQNIAGFDVNPIAVLTARTNFILAITPFIKSNPFESLTIPVFLTDSLLTPNLEQTPFGEKVFKVSTVEGIFEIPTKLVSGNHLQTALIDIERAIRNGYTPKEFGETLSKAAYVTSGTEERLVSLYDKIYGLHQHRRDKVWIGIIRNSFAPLFNKPFDLLIGNPPWVNWEFLADDYARQLAEVNNALGAYAMTGQKTRLGYTKLDLFTTFVFVCALKYLRPHGKLAFLVKPLFQLPAGRGFRSFRIKQDDQIIQLKVLKVHDLRRLQPFEDTSNESAMVLIERDAQTEYPLSYIKWDKTDRIDPSGTLEEALSRTTRTEALASPSLSEDLLSEWSIVDKSEEKEFGALLRKILGELPYDVRQGVNFSLSHVFWVDILAASKDKVQVKNFVEESRLAEGEKSEKQTIKWVDKDFVYPLIKSRHLKKWGTDGYIYAIIPQRVMGEDNETDLKTSFPDTYGYLKKYEDDLGKRKSVWFKTGPFYSIYSVREYTFAPFKVAFVNLGYRPEFSVISSVDDNYLGKKLLIPEHVLSFIPFQNEEEAHYACAVLNSKPVTLVLDSLSGRGKSGLTKSLLDKVRIPKYDSADDLHRRLSELSRKAHSAFATGDAGELAAVESQVNKLVVELYLSNRKSGLSRWLTEE